MKSFKAKDGSGEPLRINETHASTTDSEAKLHRKGKGRLS